MVLRPFLFPCPSARMGRGPYGPGTWDGPDRHGLASSIPSRSPHKMGLRFRSLLTQRDFTSELAFAPGGESSDAFPKVPVSYSCESHYELALRSRGIVVLHCADDSHASRPWIRLSRDVAELHQHVHSRLIAENRRPIAEVMIESLDESVSPHRIESPHATD